MSILKVQDELALTAEQKQKLDELRKATADKQREVFAEMQKRAAELYAQSDADARKLLDEKQISRLEQLRLQREGTIALTKPEIMEKLGLNQEQRDKLTKLAAEYLRSPAGGVFGRGGAPAPAAERGAENSSLAGRAEQVRAAHDRIASEIISILTPEQKTKWDGLVGSKFDFPLLVAVSNP